MFLQWMIRRLWEVFSYMSFKEAIERELLTDYKVITIEVKKEEVAEFIRENNLVKLNAKWGKESEARSSIYDCIKKSNESFAYKKCSLFPFLNRPCCKKQRSTKRARNV